jgi:hypothetical protein
MLRTGEPPGRFLEHLRRDPLALEVRPVNGRSGFQPAEFCFQRLDAGTEGSGDRLRWPSGARVCAVDPLRLAFRKYFSRNVVFGRRSDDWVGGIAMDSTALQELIAQVRSTAADLAATEQRVASFTAELAQLDRGAQRDARPAQQNRTPIAKRGSSGWVPAG